jgi:hypothetical protein
MALGAALRHPARFFKVIGLAIVARPYDEVWLLADAKLLDDILRLSGRTPIKTRVCIYKGDTHVTEVEHGS